ncbi:MAG: MauE/DoxX family redox-associated membrane protein [Candidatus Hydrogenedentales bacterium]
MQRVAAEKILGIVFVLAAALKAWDLEVFAFQIRYYHVLEAPGLLWAAAVGAVAWETLLGVALVAGLRLKGWTFALVGATLIGFTGLILYAWAFYDLQDCGCFGSLVPLGPASTTAKNVVLLALTALAWRRLPRGQPHASRSLRSIDIADLSGSGEAHASGNLWQHSHLKAGVSAGACVLVILAGIYRVPFEDFLAEKDAGGGQVGPSLIFRIEHEGETYDTSRGEYLLAFLSDICDECQAEIPLVNDLTLIPEFPKVLAFMLVENDETLESFRKRAEFPCITMDLMEWFQYIDEAPPRFYLVRDGEAVCYWDEHVPPIEEVLAAREGRLPKAGLADANAEIATRSPSHGWVLAVPGLHSFLQTLAPPRPGGEIVKDSPGVPG